MAWLLIGTAFNVGLWVFFLRTVRGWVDEEPGYFSVDVEGAERWFCSFCGKEEGACARCEEVVV